MSIREQYKILEFGRSGDERGKLVVVEGMQDIPFEIKRYSISTVLTAR